MCGKWSATISRRIGWMARRTVLIALAVSAAAFAVAAGAFWGLRRPAPDAAADQEAVALFAMKLPDADGVERPLLAWRGKLRGGNFWATRGAPFVGEKPQLQPVSAGFAPRQFRGLRIRGAHAC